MTALPNRNQQLQTSLLGIISLLCYVKLGYFTHRADFYELAGTFTLAFGAYFLLLKQQLSWKVLLGLGILFRLAFLPALPNLSDDYFRFIWDGVLNLQGINPFLELPSFYMQPENRIEGLTETLFTQMNSPEYFTIYPPVCQFVFSFGALGGEDLRMGSLLMRSFIVLAEIGSLLIIIQLLKKLKLPLKHLGLYALNPMIIAELTGNLHFEAIMIFFLLVSFYLLINQRNTLSALVFSLAVGTKLLPLMLLPLFFGKLGFKETMKFCIIVGLAVLIQFTPFISIEMIAHIWDSIDLYFQRFEFNASLYYLARWAGYKTLGYNIVKWAGPALSVLVLATITYLSFKPSQNWKDWLAKSFWAFMIYLACATIVHPWYASTLIALIIFIPYRFAIVWSGTVLLSYITYQTTNYQESIYLILVEYLLVIAFFLWERKGKKHFIG